jgi:Protein tyrosine and serine/threonine kinase/SH2 domain
MAPEVLAGEAFNEKADVYSFGIVLWEILTRREPFQEFESIEEFRVAICVENVRPPIPSGTHPSMSQLLEACWHPVPSKRPSFSVIIDQLDQIIVDCAVADQHGRRMWKEVFLKKTEVRWSELLSAFTRLISPFIPRPEPWPADQRLPEQPTPYQLQHCTDKQLEEYGKRSQENWFQAAQEYSRRASPGAGGSGDGDSGLDELSVKCLRTLLIMNDSSDSVVDNDSEPLVELERFGQICEFFGPIVEADGSFVVLERMKSLCSKSWFHGDVSTREAENKLASRPHGTFLVRFSTSKGGNYTISKVSPTSINHQRITHAPGHGFHVNNKRYRTLEDLISLGADELKLYKPCPGSKLYTELFVDPKVSGYVQAEEELDM